MTATNTTATNTTATNTTATNTTATNTTGVAPGLVGNRGSGSVDAYTGHLEEVLVAVTAVSSAVRLLAACRYAPAPVIEAAVSDLADSLRGLQALGPAGGRKPLAEMHAEFTTGDNPDPRVQALRTAIATTVGDIEADSGLLSLELRRLMADLRDVVSLGTGSTGTYDSSGRTTLGDGRRRFAVM